MHEAHEYNQWFLNSIRRGQLIVDLGAYVGGYSVRASKLGAEVISIEPDKKNFSILRRNIELNKCSTIHVINLAAD
jgi:FkbM family methyltransferase